MRKWRWQHVLRHIRHVHLQNFWQGWCKQPSLVKAFDLELPEIPIQVDWPTNVQVCGLPLKLSSHKAGTQSVGKKCVRGPFKVFSYRNHLKATRSNVETLLLVGFKGDEKENHGISCGQLKKTLGARPRLNRRSSPTPGQRVRSGAARWGHRRHRASDGVRVNTHRKEIGRKTHLEAQTGNA